MRLRRKQQSRVQRQELDFFVVAAVGFVLHAAGRREIAAVLLAAATAHVDATQLEPWRRQKYADARLLLESIGQLSAVDERTSHSFAHVEAVGLLADFQIDDRAVFHAS